ncbi:hypothetical protein AVEN_216151-1 [Araneus ventricosus]|uniref:Integrase catalytic domain-containing protein n=1 Tax=Araneus ventricosus TaxID=182803 RepID=A0A4Y2I8R8_ARAVE|nr:hypothetical protein AVEN_216151-1 [Araneus ventricosus]
MRKPHLDNYVICNIYQSFQQIFVTSAEKKKYRCRFALSRIESFSEIDYDKIAESQIDNQDLKELRSKPSLYFKQYPLDSGPFPTSEGKTYCLTCIERFTCWIEVIPLAYVTVETVAREFYDHWISRFGMPYRVITDQGIVADDRVNCDSAEELGENAAKGIVVKRFADVTLKRKVQVFTLVAVENTKLIDTDPVVSNPNQLFHRIACVLRSADDLEGCLQHEWAPYIHSLFDDVALRAGRRQFNERY